MEKGLKRGKYMQKQYHVAFATGSRADYGIVRKYLSYLNNSNMIDLQILVTGALLSPEYGHQVDLIYKDGFKVGVEIDIELDATNNAAVIHSMSIALDKFGMLFEDYHYDMLIILGDRFEMLSVAIAAVMHCIPILHIHGGEATFGNYDEFIRHSITKMSTFHFTATEEYRQRVIQLGESPERVYNLGALGAENCLFIDENQVHNKVKELSEKKYFVVLFHPETLTNVNMLDQINELLFAIDCENDVQYIFLGSNADTHSDIIRRKIMEYVKSRGNALYFENLPTNDYHYLIKNSLGLIGNSSSGLIEAPSLGVATINIGDRQAGRVRGNSVYDVACEEDCIKAVIEKVKKSGKIVNIQNPYYKDNAAAEYFKVTKMILDQIDEIVRKPKVFYDLSTKGIVMDKSTVYRDMIKR